MQYFLDANVLISLIDQADRHHQRAVGVYEKISQQGEIFLSDVVVNETLTVMARRHERLQIGSQFAEFVKRFKEFIAPIPILSVYEMVSQNYQHIMNFMVKYHARLSFHDALIVLFLTEVPEVFLVTFDEDFSLVEGLKIVYS